MKDFNFRQEPKYTHLNMQELKSKKLVNPVVSKGGPDVKE